MIIKTCACGQAYDAAAWQLLELAYWTDDDVEVTEYRDCACGSTIGVDALALYGDTQQCDDAAALEGLHELLNTAKPLGFKATREVWRAAFAAGLAGQLARRQANLPQLDQE